MSEIALSSREARDLTDQIKTGVSALWELIKKAYITRAWEVLGYSSWDDYCTQEFGTSRIRLPREERREVVSSMREVGMSTRAIASATGAGYGTIARELSRDPNGSPSPVTGTDGKTYNPQPQPEPEPEPGPEPMEAVLTEEEIQELTPEPKPTPKPEPMEPFDHDAFEQKRARARATSSAPGSGKEILNTKNPSTDLLRMHEGADSLDTAYTNLANALEVVTGLGGVSAFSKRIQEIKDLIEAIEQANTQPDMDTKLQNMIEGEI